MIIYDLAEGDFFVAQHGLCFGYLETDYGAVTFPLNRE
jgi:hypothetical protein